MTDRFKIISNRESIPTGAYKKDEDGNMVQICTSNRREIFLQDVQQVYGGKEGIVAEFFDMQFAMKLCKILNQCWVK